MKISTKSKQRVSVLLVLLFFSISFFSSGVFVKAADIKKSTVVLGSGLTESERRATLEQLGLSADSEKELNFVSGADAKRFIDVSYDDKDMISSVLVEFKEADSGVSTEILYPQNITKIQSYQYSNAAITAGIYDTNIKVTALWPVTGESALTGVFKAAELNGVELDKDKLLAGNEELITVKVIEENNADNDDFNSEDFSKALTEIKGEIAEEIKKEGQNNITIEELTVIVNNVLIKYNINISQEDIDRLISALEKYKNTITADDVDRILKQLEVFAEDTWDMALDFLEQAQNKSWWNSFVSFINKMFKIIVEFFTNLFSRAG